MSTVLTADGKSVMGLKLDVLDLLNGNFFFPFYSGCSMLGDGALVLGYALVLKTLAAINFVG